MSLRNASLLALALVGCGEPPEESGAIGRSLRQEPAPGPSGGNVAYCPNQDTVPAANGSLCIPVPNGRPAGISWWTRAHTYEFATCTVEWDNDLSVSAGSTIVLPHDSMYLGESSSYSFQSCGGAWGYGPTFHDMVSNVNFHFNHLKPGWKTFANVAAGTVIKAGSFVGVSGGDTCETGYCNCNLNCCNGGTSCPLEGGGNSWCASTHSTGQHLCVVVGTNNMASVFGAGAVPTCAVSNDPCSREFNGGGWYCGSTIGGSANTVYLCQGYVTTQTMPCPCGCQVNPGMNDTCAACPPDMTAPVDLAQAATDSAAPRPSDGGAGDSSARASDGGGTGGPASDASSGGTQVQEGCSLGGAGRPDALAALAALLVLLALRLRRR
jgi:hypothetical protein